MKLVSASTPCPAVLAYSGPRHTQNAKQEATPALFLQLASGCYVQLVSNKFVYSPVAACVVDMVCEQQLGTEHFLLLSMKP